MTIRAVFFDMGGTLETYSFTPQLRLERTPGLQQRLVSAGIHLGLDNEGLYRVVQAGLARYHAWSLETEEELPAERVWKEYILPAYPVDPAALASIAEDLMFYVETCYYERRMRPEMPAVLQAIRAMGLKIGLISNVNSREQVLENLKKYEIFDYFHPIVLSSEYGRRKPDPAIFHYAARLAEVPTSACLYVGDRIARDILGARKAGFRLAVQIQHDFQHGEPDFGAVPDFFIHQMTELLEILRQDRDQQGSEPAARPSSLRAILFDAGDILYYRPDKEKLLQAFLEEAVPGAHEPSAADRELLTEQAYRGEMDREEYRERLLRLYGVLQPELLARGRALLEQADNQVAFFEGVCETLLALKAKGYLLGIVTDTANSVHAKLTWLERGGFGHVWDSIVSSRELGRRKPDPAIYQAALRQLGVSAQQAAFVGHKASELTGAKAVGLHTIAFNYEADVSADHFIGKFSELLDLPLLSS